VERLSRLRNPGRIADLLTAVTLKSQSISFTGAPDSGLVGGSATLSATATSGLPVTLSVDSGSGAGVCSLSGSTVTYAAAGTCLIDANQAGNATYAAVPQAQLKIAVRETPDDHLHRGPGLRDRGRRPGDPVGHRHLRPSSHALR
jgi:hypothetical protein